jgi:Ca2+-binding RTX toxin-like protein
VGGEGNDTLIGGPGFDLLVGGAGSDLFIVSRADTLSAANGDVVTTGNIVDTIIDFNAAEDHVQLMGNAFATSEEALVATTYENGNALIHYQGGVLQLLDVGQGSLTADSFLIA